MLRLAGLWCLACTLACQALAGIDEKHPSLQIDDELCRDYCKAVDENCTDDYRVYHDQNQCLAACTKLPATPAGDSDNSVECRYQVASSISSEQTDCAGAGPGGGGPGGSNVCGTNCENYCWLMSQSCSEPEFQAFWLGDLDKCNAACQGIRDRTRDEGNTGSTSLYSAADDKARDHFGDTVQCRIFHAVAASAPKADITHCWHAALSPHARLDVGSTNPCLAEPEQTEPRCTDYCRLVMVACTGDLKVYDSETQCQAGCGSSAFPAGNVKDDRPPEMATHKNSLGCRYTHAYNALISAPGNAKAHCGHASPAGDGTCGTRCEAYCYQLFATCPNEAKDKRDVAQCTAECNASPDAASLPYSIKRAKSGEDLLACRLYALTEARAAMGKADVTKSKCEVAAGRRACP